MRVGLLVIARRSRWRAKGGKLMVSGQPRNFTIDVLRGTSICLVLLLHFHLSYSLLDSPLALVLPVGMATMGSRCSS